MNAREPKEAPTVDRIEALPLSYPLVHGRHYGSAKGFVTARSSTLVRLTTSDGLTGWGECFGPVEATAALVRSSAEVLRGQRLDAVTNLTLSGLEQSYHTALAGVQAAAVSGIDMAMWDAWARTLGVSVSSLLGARLRERVKAYASTGYMTPTGNMEQFSAAVRSAADRGFTATKIRLGPESTENARRLEQMASLRSSGHRLMVDFNASLRPENARRELQALEDHDVHWVEEPLPPWDNRGWKNLRHHTRLPLAAGEALSTRFTFAALLGTGTVDVLQPDLTLCGGITEGWAICQLAVAHNARISPHVWGSGIGQAASLQLLAAVPDVPAGARADCWFEWDCGENPLRDALLQQPLHLEDGFVVIPDAPGLGVTPDEDVVTELLVDA